MERGKTMSIYKKIWKTKRILDLFNNERHYGGHNYKERTLKYLSFGNIMFVLSACVLFVIFFIAGLVDIFENLAVGQWLSSAWSGIKDFPIFNMINYSAAEKAITDIAKDKTVEDIASIHLSFSWIVPIVTALLDEFLGVLILLVALLVRFFSLFTGRISLLFSWFLLVFSTLPCLAGYFIAGTAV